MQAYISEIKNLVSAIELTLNKLDSLSIDKDRKNDMKEWLRYSWLMMFNVYDTLVEIEEDSLDKFNWN